jgi:hypothetical protein
MIDGCAKLTVRCAKENYYEQKTKSAFLAGAREYAKQVNKKKKTRTKEAAERAEELRLDSIVGDEPPVRGGMAMAAGNGYKRGGKIDGCAKRGRTNCKMR